MNTKLTLRLDDHLIADAKRVAKLQGKSLSRVVADYFVAFSEAAGSNNASKEQVRLSPVTHSLIGILPPDAGNEDDYKKHLEEKFL